MSADSATVASVIGAPEWIPVRLWNGAVAASFISNREGGAAAASSAICSGVSS